MWYCKIGDLLYYVAVQYSADENGRIKDDKCHKSITCASSWVSVTKMLLTP